MLSSHSVYGTKQPPNRNTKATVTSISLDVAGLVGAPGLRGRVESAFPEACNLATEEGRRFSLVSKRVGDGPINAVVDAGRALCLVNPGAELAGDGQRLVVGKSLTIDLCSARVWSPYPNYHDLALRPARVLERVAYLQHALPLVSPQASLAAQPSCLGQGALGGHPALSLAQARAADRVTGLLAAYRHRNLAGIQANARHLAGLGPGLTPAGDDWLAGWLVGLRCLATVAPGGEALSLVEVGRTVVCAAAGRTTGFSLTLLEAAARGATAQPWHDLLDALAGVSPEPIDSAVREIVRRGATSGFDMLAGFLAAFAILR